LYQRKVRQGNAEINAFLEDISRAGRRGSAAGSGGTEFRREGKSRASDEAFPRFRRDHRLGDEGTWLPKNTAKGALA
jgi:hypothetical protein